MARIVLASFGSLGDLHPMLALALELRHRGHRAEIATSENYRETISALGLPFHALRPGLAIVDDVLVRRIMAGHNGTVFLMRDLMFPSVADMYADLAPVAAGADLLVASELVYAAPPLSERTGLPWVSYSLAPISLFSIHDPPVLPVSTLAPWIRSRGPIANRVLRRIAKMVSYGWWRPVRRLRRELGLGPTASPLFGGKYSPRLELVLFSRALQPPQPDWPASAIQCGFPFYDETETTPELPPAITAFLAAGPAPVVFTLGSAAVKAADDFFLESARAASKLGCRALLIMGTNPPPPDLSPSILVWDYLPYARIFPRAAAIVHQGGIGTTAQALRAGRPTLVVPCAHDQFDNAARVTRLGCGRTLPRRRYFSDTVSRELSALLDDPRAAQVAAALGERVRSEQGVTAACDALERALHAGSPGQLPMS